MTFLPKNMQFKPMNHFYEEGKNPWGVLHYGERTIVVCGSKKEYDRIVDKQKLPNEIFEYTKSNQIHNLILREYPEKILSSMRLQFDSTRNNFSFDYLIDL